MLAESYVLKLANACNHRTGIMVLPLRRLHDLTQDLELDDQIDRERIAKAYRSAIARVSSDFEYVPCLHVRSVTNVEMIGITELANLICLAASGMTAMPRKRIWEVTTTYQLRLVSIYNVFVHLLIDKRAATRKEVRSAADRFMRDWGKHMTDPRKVLMVADRLRHLSHRESDHREAMKNLLTSLHEFDGAPDDLEFEAIAIASLSTPEDAS